MRGSHHNISMELGRTSENDSRKTIDRKTRVRKICLENEYMGMLTKTSATGPHFKTLKRVNHITERSMERSFRLLLEKKKKSLKGCPMICIWEFFKYLTSGNISQFVSLASRYPESGLDKFHGSSSES